MPVIEISSLSHPGVEMFCTLTKTFSIFFLAENKRLTKNCGLNANDLETSEVPYLTLFCIKTKERFVYLQIYKKSLINTLIY